MIFDLRWNDFNFLRHSDCLKIAGAIKGGEAEIVAKVYAEYLAAWNGREWVDYDRIHVTTAELRDVGLWDKISPTDFLSKFGSLLTLEMKNTFVDCIKSFGFKINGLEIHV